MRELCVLQVQKRLADEKLSLQLQLVSNEGTSSPAGTKATDEVGARKVRDEVARNAMAKQSSVAKESKREDNKARRTKATQSDECGFVSCLRPHQDKST